MTTTPSPIMVERRSGAAEGMPGQIGAGEEADCVYWLATTGMTREEIAGRIKRPVSTVKTWLRRSLAQLKDCLGQ